MVPTKYQISIDDSVIRDLMNRLSGTRLPDTPADAGWSYGVNVEVLKEYLAYWSTDYDWRRQEEDLNQREHFLVSIEELDVHFIHQKSPYPNAIPLLLLHGWPSCFIQMLDLADELEKLATPDLSFDLVIPSLPGYGFSARPVSQGFGTQRAAAIVHKLMRDVLGYDRYAIRAGDIGKLVADWLCNDHPQSIVGAHLAEIIMPGPMEAPEDATQAEREFVLGNNLLWQGEMSYCLQHMTKPQTLAVGLNDSPAGLLAWILEKFQSWSGVSRDLSEKFSKDQLLTVVTIYWATQTISSSIRIYYEFIREDRSAVNLSRVPVGFCMGERDLFPLAPEEWARRFYNVVRFNCCSAGGHFLEWDSAEFVANDIRAFVHDLVSQ